MKGKSFLFLFPHLLIMAHISGCAHTNEPKRNGKSRKILYEEFPVDAISLF
jgi:hypothetical protein